MGSIKYDVMNEEDIFVKNVIDIVLPSDGADVEDGEGLELLEEAFGLAGEEVTGPDVEHRIQVAEQESLLVLEIKIVVKFGNGLGESAQFVDGLRVGPKNS